jgi:hypothetical protein
MGLTSDTPVDSSIDSDTYFRVVGVYSESGVDLSLLRERLTLIVTERWQRNFDALRVVEAFREAGRARRTECSAAARGHRHWPREIIVWN